MPARLAGVPVRRFVATVCIGLCIVLVWMTVRELITFEHQARLLASVADEVRFEVAPGPSDSVRFPVSGETDERLGHTRLPNAVTRLQEAGFGLDAQARWSPRLVSIVDMGLYAPYRRKQGAGLVLLDRHGSIIYRGSAAGRSYAEFHDIPPLVVKTLLYIENQELLDDRHRYRNPAVEWDRLAHSLTLKAVSVVGADRKTPGASTLATQLEKYHHSPGGRTHSAGEKVRQMVSASLRAYLDGEDTVATRQRIVVEYLNTVPLAAAPGIGEVHGLGNGMHAWFGTDFQRFNRLLADPKGEEGAQAYRQLLTLLIAQRRPSYYLQTDRDALAGLTDAYLRLLGRDGVIPAPLLEAAQSVNVTWQRPGGGARVPYPERKWPYYVRARLSEMLDVPTLYDLDRWDLTAATTIDGAAQARVVEFLRRLSDPEQAQLLGLNAPGLLEGRDPAGVTYSVTVMEHVGGANLVRVQADNADRPLDINRGVKLDLGSTAKLRTLVTYLDVIARLHERFSALPRNQLLEVRAQRNDALGRWVIEELLERPAQSGRELLERAMQRSYSASPRQAFFTGGGRHVFSNFDADDNHRTMPVAEAFERSVNLVFVRMMADVVASYRSDSPHSSQRVLDQQGGPQRDAYLTRFADQEGTGYLRRFHGEYRHLSREQVLEKVLDKARPTPAAMAAVLASLDPAADVEALRTRVERLAVQNPLSPAALEKLLERHGPEALSLHDRGFVARIHPLELWLAARLYQGGSADLTAVLADSREVRQQVYQWLFRTRQKSAQDRRIATLLEQEAFVDIHAFWRRLGYPFPSLVPSLATAIGSSADHPAALTELLGIIANDGVRFPTVYLTELEFATGTPYETRMSARPLQAERVLPEAVASVTRAALTGVVARGTARRLNGLAPELAAIIGGKTGTGDHRFERYGAGGRLLESRAVNRSAVFTFVIGDRFFGTVTAFVPGEAAAGYRFTSALPVQVLGHLLPQIHPMLIAAPLRSE